ncbi:PREDICTED: uncharacterized protein LOC104597623 [Nelumbo nucifera]|uniref:DUF538 domain-containing protein n=2 Tax=Nelumbo nucifera TaxID=4432 RepID=A0A822ZC74_NELNU|nr:PREDICTED: uncharacterized protein LOC104597623 [Nelumbo nucifera]DAD42133.1 TPA_asm: hypothetical protein HUJ06_000363 [Nelumbo nucifera]
MAKLVSATILCFFSLLCSTATRLTIATPDDDVVEVQEIYTVEPPVTGVHDLLPAFGLPKGLLPNAVKSYLLSENGDFHVELQHPCYVHFDELVWYDKKITGKLSYGKVRDVSGIQAKKLFLWVSVTGIQADEASDMITFYVGALSEKLPAKQFETIPECKSKACQGRKYLSSLISEV